MSAPENHGAKPDDLRRRAEDRIREKPARAPETPESPPAENASILLHELQVHQIELEMQNEELRRSQEELEASHARYFDLYDLAPVGYCTLSEQGLIQETNLTAAALLGVARSALLQKPLAGFIFPGDQDIYRRHQKQLFATGERQQFELRMLNARAAPFWARVEATATRDAGRDVPVWRAVLVDISALKRVEEVLQHHESELAEKNAALERFTSAVSHDLKSPLSTISTFLELLKRDIRNKDAGEIDNSLEAIRKATKKMFGLLNELSDMLRVGHRPNPLVEAPLREVVTEALDQVAGSVAKRGVSVVVTREPVALRGDRPRLVEIFQNLVDNAVKFMGAQPAPRVEIGVEHAGDETVIFVRDNGLGIDPRHQQKIFVPFEKLDPTTQGTGLGLALVKRIVEVHGGRIWVESEGEGRGATFRFTLAQSGSLRRDVRFVSPES